MTVRDLTSLRSHARSAGFARRLRRGPPGSDRPRRASDPLTLATRRRAAMAARTTHRCGRGDLDQPRRRPLAAPAGHAHTVASRPITLGLQRGPTSERLTHRAWTAGAPPPYGLLRPEGVHARRVPRLRCIRARARPNQTAIAARAPAPATCRLSRTAALNCLMHHRVNAPARKKATPKARSTSRTTFAGMGLGLYIARGVVEQHGGTIWVESTDGTGSTFHLALPSPVDAGGPSTRGDAAGG